MTSDRSPLGPLLIAGLLCTPAWAHDDDPKVLDRIPPVSGPGFRSSAPIGFGGGGNPAAAFDSQGVTLLSWLPLNQLDGASSGNDCWGYVSGSGREYALMGTSSGTVVVEITDPGNPVVVAQKSGPSSLWRDIKVYGTHMYAVSEGGSGIQVFDLANVDQGQVPLVATITTGGGTSTHNVAIDTASGYLYRLGGDNNGCRVYDLSNPTNPPFVGSWSSRYIHDAQPVTYTSGPYAGRQLLFACSGLNGGWDQTGLTILDVTNKGSIQVLSQSYYPGPGYSHQGWLSPDLRYFYLGDELDEDGITKTTTHVFDVLDPAAPVYIGKFSNGNPAITHNLYTKGNLIYEANYTSGLRIFDATNPTNPVEVGYFDTFPGGDPVSFNGLWNVYPYFPSGTVIGSDLESGLFVWHVGDAPIAIELPAGAPDILDPAGDAVAVTITEQNPGDLQAGSEMLAYDDGSGFTLVPLANLGGGNYQAVFPAIACGTEVAWYVQANDSTGFTWTNPEGAPGAVHLSRAAAGLNLVSEDTMESNTGWTGGVSGDTATTGIWTRVDPVGTAAQPEDDHTVSGTKCWVTGQGQVGGGIGDNDVDNGYTTLLSPVLDLSAYADPVISYWRWFSNNQNGVVDDVFRVDISGNGGSTWTSVEVVGPSGGESSGGWYLHGFRVADFVGVTSQVRVRFRAEDVGSGSIVEAAIDDFRVEELLCDSGGPGVNYCQANANSTGLPAEIDATGSDVVADNDLTLIARQLPANKFGYFLASLTQDFVTNVPGSQGNLCLGGQIVRYAQTILNSGPTGEFSMAVDLTSIPPPYNGPVLPGQTWFFQAWYRDVNPTQTSNFTDGRSILFQ